LGKRQVPNARKDPPLSRCRSREEKRGRGKLPEEKFFDKEDRGFAKEGRLIRKRKGVPVCRPETRHQGKRKPWRVLSKKGRAPARQKKNLPD